jgi:hypothetical protein
MEQAIQSLKNATFKVKTEAGEIVKEYTLPYENYRELGKLFQEARKVWDEYFVEVVTEFIEMSYPRTYIQELKEYGIR